MGDRDYLYRRAEAEISMAERAACQIAAKVHYELAGRYLDRFLEIDGAGPGRSTKLGQRQLSAA